MFCTEKAILPVEFMPTSLPATGHTLPAGATSATHTHTQSPSDTVTCALAAASHHTLHFNLEGWTGECEWAVVSKSPFPGLTV